ncbi:hypothetical protein ACOSP7_021184 [Xanthoceras sorbifolium]
MDAGIDESLQRPGIGIVIRDCHGLVMASCAQGLDSLLSPPIAEALAILRCLKLAIETGLLAICVESDAHAELVERTDVASLAFVSRKANQVAHWLAKFGLSFINEFVLLEDCPLCVESLVLDDCPA